MNLDSIVDEVRANREAYAERFGFDLDAIHRDVKEREQSGDHQIVSLAPKRIQHPPLEARSETRVAPVLEPGSRTDKK